jgi:hypothetical protein
MKLSRRLLASIVLAAALAGCRGSGDIVIGEGVGITAVRTACPAVGIPNYTGDVTLFRTPGDRTASNIDVTATITNLRSTCDETGAKVYTEAGFDVLARRTDTSRAQRVELPYFSAVLRGGSAVQAKRVGTVVIDFAAGQERAQAHAKAAAYVDRAAASLPEDVREKITRERKAGDPDAAVDPLADPEVRTALASATFELLVGFNLTQDQLQYNATR